MAVAVDPDVLLPMIPISGTLLLPSCWFTWCTVRHVLEKLDSSRPDMNRVESWTQSRAPIGRPSSNQHITSDSRSTVMSMESITAKKQRKSARWTMILTALCCCLFSLSVLILFIRSIIFYSLIYNHLDDKDKIHEVRTSDLIFGLLALYCIFMFSAYCSLTIVCFQRLIITFKRSAYRLSDRTVFIGRCIIGGTFFNFLLSLSMLTIVNARVAALTALPCCVCFPSFFVWILVEFSEKTRMVARKMAGIRYSISRRLSIDESALERTKDLLDASLRLTVVCTLSILSSLVNIFCILAGMLGAPGIIITIGLVALPLDNTINCFSLLCTFRSESERYYLFVFGWLHKYLLDKLCDIVINVDSISHDNQ